MEIEVIETPFERELQVVVQTILLIVQMSKGIASKLAVNYNWWAGIHYLTIR